MSDETKQATADAYLLLHPGEEEFLVALDAHINAVIDEKLAASNPPPESTKSKSK